VQPTAAAATVTYRVNPTIHPPRAAVRRRRRSGFDGQTAVLLVLLVPLLSALIMYVVEAVQLASKPVQAASTDLSLVPGGRPTARGTAEAAFLMVHTQPPSKALGQKAFNLIQSRGDGTPEGELLRAVGRRLLQTGATGDVEGWQEAVSELCVLAGHC
jgi:hypothetical protein